MAANSTALQKSVDEFIWILNEKVQIDSSGQFVSGDTSPYTWIRREVSSLADLEQVV